MSMRVKASVGVIARAEQYYSTQRAVCRGTLGVSPIQIVKVVEFLMGETNEKHLGGDEGLIDNEEDPQVEYVDVAKLSPVGDEEIFSHLINKMVAENAPRVFALCEEIGERVDAGTVAWGMSFQDGHTELVYGLDGRRTRIRLVCGTPERARDFFAARSAQVGCSIRLVWVDQAQAHIKTT